MRLQSGCEIPKGGLWTGREQCNNRAEPLATNAAMRVQDGNLGIRSDSEYVVRVAVGLLQCERQLNNEGKAALWAEFVTDLRLKTTRLLDFVWVKGHSTKVHIDRQVTTTLDKGGNDAADSLASATASQHAAPQGLTAAATKRQRVALSTHVCCRLAFITT